MKIFTELKQPSGMGTALFTAAALVLIAMIVTGQAGLLALAAVLGMLAQPLCAMAIAVLMYVALAEAKADNRAQ